MTCEKCKPHYHSEVCERWTEQEGMVRVCCSEITLCPLHSAAPGLLQACKDFVHWYSEDSTEFNRDMAYEAAVSAIAKATEQGW